MHLRRHVMEALLTFCNLPYPMRSLKIQALSFWMLLCVLTGACSEGRRTQVQIRHCQSDTTCSRTCLSGPCASGSADWSISGHQEGELDTQDDASQGRLDASISDLAEPHHKQEDADIDELEGLISKLTRASIPSPVSIMTTVRPPWSASTDAVK